MISKEELLEILEEQKKKYTYEKVASSFKKWNKTIQYHFTDREEYYSFELVNGQPGSIIEGKIENPDIEYTMSTETFMSLVKKEITGFKLYQQKKIKVKASMPELLKLQKLDKI
ncbi:MAG: SCP2 sterol-binding domain-containing protein [Candidatus Thorarchaeota archaeon]